MRPAAATARSARTAWQVRAISALSNSTVTRVLEAV